MKQEVWLQTHTLTTRQQMCQQAEKEQEWNEAALHKSWPGPSLCIIFIVLQVSGYAALWLSLRKRLATLRIPFILIFLLFITVRSEHLHFSHVPVELWLMGKLLKNRHVRLKKNSNTWTHAKVLFLSSSSSSVRSTGGTTRSVVPSLGYRGPELANLGPLQT